MLVSPKYAILIFFVILFISVAAAWGFRDFRNFDRSSFHSFILILGGLGVFVTFMFYYNTVELQQEQQNIQGLQELTRINLTMSTNVLAEMHRLSHSNPDFVKELMPLQEFENLDSGNDNNQIKNDISDPDKLNQDITGIISKVVDHDVGNTENVGNVDGVSENINGMDGPRDHVIESDVVSDGGNKDLANLSNIKQDESKQPKTNNISNATDSSKNKPDTPIKLEPVKSPLTHDQIISIHLLSAKIFSLWQDVIYSQYFLMEDLYSYTINFLQWASSPQLRKQWEIQKYNYSPRTQVYGNLLFRHRNSIVGKEIHEYKEAASQLFEHGESKCIFRDKHLH